MSHRIRRSVVDRLKRLAPFGLGHNKPKHYREMAAVVWENRDNLPYAWKVLTRGVCDGCALGVAGLHDWTIDGVHLCMTRLNLMRLNTMPELDHALLDDVSRLRSRSNEELRELGRLAYPMRRQAGEAGFSRISWGRAYATIADRIRAAEPQRLAFYLTSRGLTNEAYYAAQKAVRLFGTNNIDNAARICHSPSTAGLKGSLGVAATTCSYTDMLDADLVVFFGANPANDQPVVVKYLRRAKKNGARIALVNPYREPAMERYWIPSTPASAVFGTELADWWFPVSTGGDIAFLYGVLKTLVEERWYDRRFVEEYTTGFEEIVAAVEGLAWEEIVREVGIDREGHREFAALIRDADKAVLVWSMGITQHAHGGDNVQMIVNLGLSKGFVGREGCGLMPIRGHSGVQGGAEMGAYATAFPGGRPVDSAAAAEMSELYGFDVPSGPGLTAPEMVAAAHRGELDLLYCVGGNFVRTLPDPGYVIEAMQRVPLRVHQDIILNEQALLEPAAGDPGGGGGHGGEVVLLPARTRYEQEGGGTQTSTERRIMLSPEIPRQVGEARSEWRIWLELARAVDPERAGLMGFESAGDIRQEIARVAPAYDGIQHLRDTGDALQYGGPRLCEGWEFPTRDGKARFRAVDLPRRRHDVGWFDLSTRRGRQFNSIIYREVDPITDAPRDAVFMNPHDAATLDLVRDDPVRLVNDEGDTFEGRVFPAPIARGNLQVHFPEGNVLVARDLVDAVGGVPDYNARVRVEKR